MSPIRTRWRQSSRRAMSSFPNRSKIPVTACVDSSSRTLTATFCFSVALVHDANSKPKLTATKSATLSRMDAATLEEQLPLTPAVFHILLVLTGGYAHGYAIMLEADRLTDGKMHLGPGTLYRSIYKMALDGLVEEVKEEPRPSDERRVTYRITRTGLQLARAEARRLDALVRVARRRGLLSSKPAPGPHRSRRRVSV